MDQERFDRFARGLAAGLSRRGMMRNLAGAAIGGIVVAVGGSEAGARKRKRGRGKRKGQPVCTPKTCAELGRTCGSAPDDGCGNPLDCGGEAVCGSEISTNCCAGKCCKANGVGCSSNAECCNGDCLKFLGFGTCNAFTDYTCAP
jgi:hypothetical protein